MHRATHRNRGGGHGLPTSDRSGNAGSPEIGSLQARRASLRRCSPHSLLWPRLGLMKSPRSWLLLRTREPTKPSRSERGVSSDCEIESLRASRGGPFHQGGIYPRAILVPTFGLFKSSEERSGFFVSIFHHGAPGLGVRTRSHSAFFCRKLFSSHVEPRTSCRFAPCRCACARRQSMEKSRRNSRHCALPASNSRQVVPRIS